MNTIQYFKLFDSMFKANQIIAPDCLILQGW